MKTTELMIGDWVYMEANRGYKAQYIQVETIPDASSKDHYGHIGAFPVGGDNDFRDIEDRHLSPVPLTPEILEKNGFKVEQTPIGWRKAIWESEDTRTEIVIYMDDTMPMEIRKNIYYEDEVCYTLPFVWAVHELQHALRLCGIDKEIIL